MRQKQSPYRAQASGQDWRRLDVAKHNINKMRLSGVLFVVGLMFSGLGNAEPRPLRFAGDDHYPPFEWLTRNGEPRGFVVDLQLALAAQGGRDAQHRLMSWPDAQAALRTGEVDVVAMFASPSRARDFLFTTPFYFVTHGIYGPVGTEGVPDLGALEGRRVALEDGGYAAETLQQGDMRVIPVIREDYRAALQALLDGQADFALLPQPVANRTILRESLPLQVLGPPLWPRAYVFAVSRDQPELHGWLQQQLGLVVSSGRYYDIYQQWRDEIEWNRQSYWQQYAAWIILAALVLGLMLLMIYGYSWRLRAVVKRLTGQLENARLRKSRAEKEMLHWEFHDRLTGLPTRPEFVARARAHLLRAERKGISHVMIVAKLSEIDDFICSLGFATGETLISEVARRLKRKGYAALCYMGRGVFALLAQDKTVLAEGLLDDQSIVFDGLELEPRFTIGLAHCPLQDTDVGEVLRQAETAMAFASRSGCSWMEYRQSMDPDPQNLFIIRDFRRFGRQGLRVMLQPQVDLTTGKVVGAEVLVRWRHPEMGELSPAHFVPLLEQAGLVEVLTEFVLEEAVRIAAELRRKGLPTCLSVNVSAMDLLETDLGAKVDWALAANGGEAGDLRLEMTETSMISEPDRVSMVIEKLVGMGVVCSIDDFGVGYSSMSHLRQFAVSEVKIDRSFVYDMLEQQAHHAIVSAVIALCHELKLTVVAEGPEDWQTVRALKALKCDRAQGYVFSRPVEIEDFIALREQTFTESAAQESA